MSTEATDNRPGLGALIMAAAGGLATLATSLAATSHLWDHGLLYTRSPILASVALVAHAMRRQRPSVLVAGLHLTALELCVTDLMSTGTWATGWGGVTGWRVWLPVGLSLLTLAFSTSFAYRRMETSSATRATALVLALFAGLVGTATGRSMPPIIGWVVLGSCVSALALVWVNELYNAMLTRAEWPLPRLRQWLPILAVWVVAASALLSSTVFESVPHVPDEVGYWFHAKYLAAGRLWLASPPDWNSFVLPNSWETAGRWYSIFPPGWPSVLALGFLVDAPTMVNPVLAGATLVALFVLLHQLYDLQTAAMACILISLSPEFLLMSAGLMSHPLSALCTLGAADALHRAWRNKTRWPAAIAGAAIGVAALTRPFEGLLLAAAFGAYMLSRLRWLCNQGLIGSCLLCGMTAAGIVAVYLPYNYLLTGSPLVDPITTYFNAAYYPGSNRLGFGPDIANLGWGNDLLPGHSPLEAILNAQLNAQLMQSELFAWPFGSLAAVVVYLRWWRKIGRPEDTLFVAIITSIVIGHAFYWYSGADYGARYWYQAVIPCVVLSARALTQVRMPTQAVTQTAFVTCLVGTAAFLPWRAVTKYAGYRGMSGNVVRLHRACDMSDGLVLVRNAMPPRPFHTYAAAALLNDPDLAGHAPIFAREVSPEITARLRAAFPGRPVWIIEVPSDPGGIAKVVHRPPDVPLAAGCLQ